MIRWKLITISIVILLEFSACLPEALPIASPTHIHYSTTPPPTHSTNTPSPPAQTSSFILPETDVISLRTARDVVLLQTLHGHSNRVLDVAFSAQGRYIASSGQDMKIRLWDVTNGQELHAFSMKSVDMADIDISISKNLLASAEAIWSLESMQESLILERGSQLPGSVAFSPDGTLLALGLFDQQITLWNVASGQPVHTFEKLEENRTKGMEFSPDGALLAVGVIDGSVRIIDISSGEIIKILKYAGETDNHDLAFSPDGKYLASGGRVSAVILWDVISGKVVRTFRLTDHAISMDFSPDGTVLATAGGYEHEVRLWDVESGNLLQALSHADQLTRVAFSPDGKLLAVACFDSQVYVWGIPLIP